MLWKLLNVIQAGLILLITFLSGGTVMLLRLVTGTPKYGFYVMRYFWSPWVLAVIFVKVKPVKIAKLNEDQVYIFISNHASWIDIAVVNRVIQRNLHFIAKSELKKKPFVGGAIKGMDMIFIDRGNHAEALKSLDLAVEKIRGGKNIIAYPEGTRSRTGKMRKPFKKGIFYMAIQAGVPIVPVAISGSFELAPPGFKMRPGKVLVSVGEPIPTAGLTKDDVALLMEKSWQAMHGLKSEMDAMRRSENS